MSDALNSIPERCLVSAEEAGISLKIMNDRMKDFLNSGRKLEASEWQRIFEDLYK